MILATLLALAAGTEIPPQGSGGARTYAVDGFTGVALGGFDRVRVVVGPRWSVRAEGLPADLAALKIEKDGATLGIGRRREDGNRRGRRPVTVTVTMPAIATASLGGSGTMAIDHVAAPGFTANVGGSGAMTIAHLAAQATTINLGGSGSLTATGDAGRARVSVGGSGRVGGAMTASAAAVSVAGSGGVRLAVRGEATVSMVGSGDVDLGPAARCKVNRMGSGSVRCGTRI